MTAGATAKEIARMARFDALGPRARNARFVQEPRALRNFDRHPKHLRSGPQPIVAVVSSDEAGDAEAGVQPDDNRSQGCPAGDRRLCKAGTMDGKSGSPDARGAWSILVPRVLLLSA